MISLLLGHKCMFCGERSKALESIFDYEIYNKKRFYFHRKCLTNITCDPEHYSHIQVDRAITVIDRLKEEKMKAVYRRKQFKVKCEQLSNTCLEKVE